MKNKQLVRAARGVFVVCLLITLGLSSVALAAIGFNGHQPTTSVGYTDGTHNHAYTVAPNMRQSSGSLNAARSAIWEGEQADLYVNFTYDTGGKSVFIVYTTDGTTPTKTNGSVVSAVFSKWDGVDPNGDRTWTGTIPSQTKSINPVKYVFYISNSDLASAWGRVGVNGYVTGTWTEGDDAGFSYSRLGTSAVSLSAFGASSSLALPLAGAVLALGGLGAVAAWRRRK